MSAWQDWPDASGWWWRHWEGVSGFLAPHTDTVYVRTIDDSVVYVSGQDGREHVTRDAGYRWQRVAPPRE